MSSRIIIETFFLFVYREITKGKTTLSSHCWSALLIVQCCHPVARIGT